MEYDFDRNGLIIGVHRPAAERVKSWALPALAIVAVLAVYSSAQDRDENIQLREQIAALKSRGCPERLQGRPFAGNNYQSIDLARPKYAKLSCYYGQGVQS